MPPARPIPRKYVSTVRQSLEDLDEIVEKAKSIRLQLAKHPPKIIDIRTVLHEIEIIAYRVALELSKMQIADSCENCPAAPAVTEADVRLTLLTDQLKQLADFAHSPTAAEPSALGR